MRAILTFHSIDDSGSVISFPPASLARLLEGLARADLPVLDLDTLLGPGTRRGVALTFDDGMRSVYTDALPILRDHAAPSHLFLATAAVGRDNRWSAQPSGIPVLEMLGWSELEALQAAGVRVESHTHTHPDLRAVDTATMNDECERADRLIEERLGRRPAHFAYPYGRHDARTRDAARARYAACATVALGELRGGEDPAALPRIDTYYLRSPRMQDRLDAPLPRAYLRLRGLLRRARGTE